MNLSSVIRRISNYRLPTTATAPFCPSEVHGTVEIPQGISFLKSLWLFAGPGLMVAVGYMDPGNWATDIEAGSRFGYGMLSVVLFSSVAAIILQILSARAGIATQKDLAQLCAARYGRGSRLFLWALAEIAIIACDVAEVLGTALAFKLLLGVSVPLGIGLTALDTVFVLILQGAGFRRLEALILALIAVVAICFGVELSLAHPVWGSVLRGFIPESGTFGNRDAWYLAVGIIGATVMPHNLYLHSSVVTTRRIHDSDESRASAIRLATWDTCGALFLAFFVNCAILVLAGCVFHLRGHQDVAEIQDAHRLLEPLLGTGVASLAFGVALFASGQSSTLTGTIAGQVIMEGFLKLKIPCWQRRLITRSLAIVPAWIGIAMYGEGGIGKLLVFSQVVLSLQLPFAIFPLLRLTGDSKIMGVFASGWKLRFSGWATGFAISVANIWMIAHLI